MYYDYRLDDSAVLACIYCSFAHTKLDSIFVQVANINTLLVSEQSTLEDIRELLQPFANLTDVLQTDSTSLSSIIPSPRELECHLLQHKSHRQLRSSMLKDLRTKYKISCNQNVTSAIHCLNLLAYSIQT